MKNWKNEPWRLVVGIASIAWIIYLWSSKTVAAGNPGLAPEDLLPVVVTTAAVTALKVALMAGAVWLVRWLLKKFKK